MAEFANWFHAPVTAVSRGDGKSAVGLIAYMTGETLLDEETGRWCKRNHPGEVLDWGTVAPPNAPAYLTDKSQIGKAWNDVERSEQRKNAHLANHINMASANAFTESQHIEVAKQIAQQISDRYGLMVTWAVHKPTEHGDDRNWHIHIGYNMRQVGADGFGQKARQIVAMNTRGPEARWQRQMFADTLNEKLESIGSTERVTPLSYRELALTNPEYVGMKPTRHLGDKQNQLELKGIQTRTGDENREIRAYNALRREHAEVTAQIYDLDEERRKRQAVSDTQQRPANAYADLKTEDDELKKVGRVVDQMREAEQKEKQFGIRQMIEDAQKRTQEAEQDKEVRARADKMRADAGQPNDVHSRYAQALVDNFKLGSPFESLANAAMAEYQIFRKDQNDLKTQMDKEADPGKKQSLEMRYLIQHHEYVASLCDRLAENGRHIAGHDTADARKDNADASIHREKAMAIRGDRAGIIEEQKKQATLKERDEVAKIVGRYTGAMPHNVTKEGRETYEKGLAAIARDESGKKDGLKVDQPVETAAQSREERVIEKAAVERVEVMTRYGQITVPHERGGKDGKSNERTEDRGKGGMSR